MCVSDVRWLIGPVIDGPSGPHYMCNGSCIPWYIPCQDVCLKELVVTSNRKIEIVGPIVCSDFPKFMATTTKLRRTKI